MKFLVLWIGVLAGQNSNHAWTRLPHFRPDGGSSFLQGEFVIS